MKLFFPGVVQKAIRVSERATKATRERIAYELLPKFFLDMIEKYFRVRAEGLQHIPKEGPAIFIANHSGFMALDALMLGHKIFEVTGRVPHIVAHKLWFIRPEISVHAKRLGLVPATFENALKIIKKGELLILFPEGEEGNFKPSSQRYKLKHFRRGFVRLALKTGAPVIPASVVGAEETHITLSQIRFAKELIGTIIPIPLNVIPLPAKWYLRYFKPIVISANPEKADDAEYVTRLAKQFRRDHQKRLSNQVHKRKRIFL